MKTLAERFGGESATPTGEKKDRDWRAIGWDFNSSRGRQLRRMLDGYGIAHKTENEGKRDSKIAFDPSTMRNIVEHIGYGLNDGSVEVIEPGEMSIAEAEAYAKSLVAKVKKIHQG